MSRSIISNEKKCLICGTTLNLHKHHIYNASNRMKSEKYGCWIYLCARHHNMSDHGVHFNHELDLAIKQFTQRTLETDHGWTREKFIEEFGKSYL